MTGTTHLLTLVSSSAAFAAAFFGAKWIGSLWDAYARRHVSDITPRLRALGMDEQAVRQYLRWWGVSIFATFIVLGIALSMIPVAIGVTFLVFICPRYLLDQRIKTRRLLLRDQLVRATVALANASRAGLSLPQGLESIAMESPEPLATEFRRIVQDYNAGRPLSDALREVKERLNLESFTIFASTILICMERGGRVTFALERISEDLQEMQRLERKLEADSAAGRKLAFVLGCFPLFFMAGFTLLDPVSMGYMYHTLIGQMVLLFVGAMVFFAVKWCMRILTVNF